MAGARKCLGIDLGSHTVKIVEMSSERRGVRLTKLASRRVEAAPDASAAERSAAILETARALLKEEKFSTRRAVFCISGQTVFVRPGVRVPKASEARLHQIVQFEARQLIPFPLEKTLMKYQVFPTEEDRELDVLLVAVKRETNSEHLRLVRRTGLKPVGMSVTSLALYNGQELERSGLVAGGGKTKGGKGAGLLGFFGKAGKKKKAGKGKKADGAADEGAESPEDDSEALAEMQELLGEDLNLEAGGFEEVRAYVNLGARSTDLAITRPAGSKGVGFTRFIPVGGVHMTAAIAKTLGCDFDEAEKTKVERSAALSGVFDFEADKDQYDQQACQAVTQVCDKIVAELRRSLDYFISQPDGAAVDTIVLSGGGAQLAYVASYIEERLGIPAEAPEGVNSDRVALPDDLDDSFSLSSFREAIGLAAQGLGVVPVDIDLLPTEAGGVQDIRSQYLEYAALVGMIAGMLYFSSRIGEQSVRNFEAVAAEVDARLAKDAPLKQVAAEAVSEREKINSKAEAIAQQVRMDRDFWLEFLAFMQGAKPPEVLITNLQCRVNYLNVHIGEAIIQGEAQRTSSVNQLVKNLRAAEDYIEDADIVRSSEGSSEQFTGQVTKFILRARVQRPDKEPITRLAPVKTPETEGQAGRAGAAGGPAGRMGAPGRRPMPGGAMGPGAF